MRQYLYTYLVLSTAIFTFACDGDEESTGTSAAGTEAVAGTEAEAGTETAAGTEAEAGTDTAAGTEAEAGTETEAGTEAEAGTETEAGTEAVEMSACQAYCAYLDECNSCLFDESGECADVEACVGLCEADVPEVAATCVSELTSCNEDAFNGCYDATIGDDDCARACVLLEECEQCFTNEANECLSLAACAQTCREVTPPAAAACLGSGIMCEGIDACFE